MINALRINDKWGWARKDWKIKVLSLALALVAFSAIRQVTSEVKTFRIPITVHVPEGWIYSSVYPSEAEVVLQGSKEQLGRVEESEITVTVDLRTAALPKDGGELTAPLSRRNLGNAWQQGTRTHAIQPDSVRIMVDLMTEMPIPVAMPVLRGEPLSGAPHVVWDDGKTVQVRSSKRVLNMLIAQKIRLETDEIDVRGKWQDFTQHVKVHLPVGVSGTLSPEGIEVTVQIVKEDVKEDVEEGQHGE